MPDRRKRIDEGYQPSKKGWKPKVPDPNHKPTPESGYQPATSKGDNPTKPKPPKEE